MSDEITTEPEVSGADDGEITAEDLEHGDDTGAGDTAGDAKDEGGAPDGDTTTGDPAGDPNPAGDGDQGAETVTTTEPQAGAAGAPKPEDDREVPATADPDIAPVELASAIWVRAHHNLPGWGLVAARYETLDKDGVGQGEPLNADASDGWIPNNEEGVRAVELGWAEIIETPEGAQPPASF